MIRYSSNAPGYGGGYTAPQQNNSALLSLILLPKELASTATLADNIAATNAIRKATLLGAVMSGGVGGGGDALTLAVLLGAF